MAYSLLGYGLDQGIVVRLPAMVQDFSLLQSVFRPPTLLVKGYRDGFPEIKVARAGG